MNGGQTGTGAAPSPPLSELEQAFADAMTAFVEQIDTVKAAALAIRDAGGDVKQAFLATVPEENRAALATGWPMFAMLLGLPL
jgi:hypothetical protein